MWCRDHIHLLMIRLCLFSHLTSATNGLLHLSKFWEPHNGFKFGHFRHLFEVIAWPNLWCQSSNTSTQALLQEIFGVGTTPQQLSVVLYPSKTWIPTSLMITHPFFENWTRKSPSHIWVMLKRFALSPLIYRTSFNRGSLGISIVHLPRTWA